MEKNAVMTLRKVELAKSTRPFNARGAKVSRCENCLLPLNACICSAKPKAIGECAVVLLMYKGEYFKPTNTGRLIADVVANNHAFVWHRTEPQLALLHLINDPNYYPVVVFPHEYASVERCIDNVDNIKNRKPLFIFLDGTWREAKKMFSKSDYLSHLPVMSVDADKLSDYKLREASHDFQLSTAEIAVEILAIAGEKKASDALKRYYHYFRYQYIKGKPHIKNINNPLDG